MAAWTVAELRIITVPKPPQVCPMYIRDASKVDMSLKCVTSTVQGSTLNSIKLI